MEEDIVDHQESGAPVPAATPTAAQGERGPPVGAEIPEPGRTSGAVDDAQGRDASGIERTPETRISTPRADSPMDCDADPTPPPAARTSRTANPKCVGRSPSTDCSQQKSRATSRPERPPTQTLKCTSCRLRWRGQTGTHTAAMTSAHLRGRESTNTRSQDICRCLQVEGRLGKETKQLQKQIKKTALSSGFRGRGGGIAGLLQDWPLLTINRSWGPMGAVR